MSTRTSTSTRRTTPSRGTTGRFRRGAAALVAAGLAATMLTACGQEPKVLTSYTPAAGVDAHNDTVKVSNLVLVDGDGAARVSASVVASRTDEITGISAQPLSATNDNQGSAVQAPAVAVSLEQGTPTNITDAGVELTSADLKPGLLASVTLTFKNSEPITVRTPIVSSVNPDFSSAAPTTSPSSQS